jgi:hypothetical protein
MECDKLAITGLITLIESTLLAWGFIQSSINPCLFTRKDCILIVYVKSHLLFAKTDAILGTIIASLNSEFNITSQGNVGAFLGIDIWQNGHLELV